jgi:hypothetical protein
MQFVTQLAMQLDGFENGQEGRDHTSNVREEQNECNDGTHPTNVGVEDQNEPTNIEAREENELQCTSEPESEVQEHHHLAGPNASNVLTASGNQYVTSIVPTIPTSEVSLTEKAKDRLTMIGLAIIDFAFFVARFIGHRWQYIERVPDGGWFSAGRRPLDDWRLVRHLAGDIVIGTGCRYDRDRQSLCTPYVVIDVDHNGDDADQRLRYDGVVAALGAPTYVVRSSSSGGLHVYYFLTRAEHLHALRSFDGRNGDVIRLLAAQGLREEKGRIEVYPRGQYKHRGQQSRIRAPFGAGSCLLDGLTLQPIAGTGVPSLLLAREQFESGAVRVVDPGEWIAARRALPPDAAPVANTPLPAPKADPRPVVAERPNRRAGQAPSGHDAVKVENYLTHGLTSPRQLNAAATALAFHFRFGLRLDRDEATARVLVWLDSHHNGQSRTYNASPKKARQQVAGVVERVYETVRPKTKRTTTDWVPVAGLSEFEVRTILAAFASDGEACDHSTGEPLDRYKLQKFAFELVRLAKSYVLTVISAALRESGDQMGATRGVSSVLPDRTQPVFVVAVPFRLREGRGRSGTGFLAGISRDSRWRLWRAIQAVGLFELHRPASKRANRAATYRVRLDFGALSHDAPTFPTIDAALVRCLTRDERRARYTKYRCAELERTTPDDAKCCSTESDPASALIARTLRSATNATEDETHAAA